MNHSAIREIGHAITGTRLTAHDLLPYFLDPTATEAYICRVLDLTPEQVAAVRAAVFSDPEPVLAQYLDIERQIAAGSSPEQMARAEANRATFRKFKEWVDWKRRADAAEAESTEADPSQRIPSFREWLAEQSEQP